ncbi:hypothetical protein D9M71_783760 [compost metagenome]
MLGQGFGQPFRPVALRQAHIHLRFAVLPLAGTNAGTHIQGQWLAIGQGQAGIESLAGCAGFQRRADVRQGQRRFAKRLQRDLAVEYRQLLDHLHAIE